MGGASEKSGEESTQTNTWKGYWQRKESQGALIIHGKGPIWFKDLNRSRPSAGGLHCSGVRDIFRLRKLFWKTEGNPGASLGENELNTY